MVQGMSKFGKLPHSTGDWNSTVVDQSAGGPEDVNQASIMACRMDESCMDGSSTNQHPTSMGT